MSPSLCNNSSSVVLRVMSPYVFVQCLWFTLFVNKEYANKILTMTFLLLDQSLALSLTAA